MTLVRWMLVGAILAVGIFGLFLHSRLLAKTVAVNILNSGLVLLFVLLGAELGTEAPILFVGNEDVVDPMLQALMLTAIVIGVCVTALLLVLIVRLYRITGSSRVNEIEKRIRDAEH